MAHWLLRERMAEHHEDVRRGTSTPGATSICRNSTKATTKPTNARRASHANAARRHSGARESKSEGRSPSGKA